MPPKKIKKTLFEKITEARELLDIPDEATLDEIKKKYKSKILIWHPDKCKEESELCKENTQKLVEAYKLIRDYCKKYKYSFLVDDVEKHAPYEEMWHRLYGNDPMWGPP